MCVITSRRTRATAAEEDAVREQQLKQTQSGAAADGCGHMKLVLARLTQLAAGAGLLT